MFVEPINEVHHEFVRCWKILRFSQLLEKPHGLKDCALITFSGLSDYFFGCHFFGFGEFQQGGKTVRRFLQGVAPFGQLFCWVPFVNLPIL